MSAMIEANKQGVEFTRVEKSIDGDDSEFLFGAECYNSRKVFLGQEIHYTFTLKLEMVSRRNVRPVCNENDLHRLAEKLAELLDFVEENNPHARGY